MSINNLDDLQLLLKHGQDYLAARSDYGAVQDDEACVDRCVFGARVMRPVALQPSRMLRLRIVRYDLPGRGR
jgi:hypothetical protein